MGAQSIKLRSCLVNVMCITYQFQLCSEKSSTCSTSIQHPYSESRIVIFSFKRQLPRLSTNKTTTHTVCTFKYWLSYLPFDVYYSYIRQYIGTFGEYRCAMSLGVLVVRLHFTLHGTTRVYSLVPWCLNYGVPVFWDYLFCTHIHAYKHTHIHCLLHCCNGLIMVILLLLPFLRLSFKDRSFAASLSFLLHKFTHQTSPFFPRFFL